MAKGGFIMYRFRILSEKEVEAFNKKNNTNYYSIHIEQENNKFYMIIDCDIKIETTKKEVLDYLK